MYPSAHQQKTPLMRGFLLVPGAAFQIVSRDGYPNDPKHRSQLGKQGAGLHGAPPAIRIDGSQAGALMVHVAGFDPRVIGHLHRASCYH
ncbi:conserved hypothetical protein [Xanthomonas citri pv. fuscans]|nr:conserved hypothetical protein [Xanthomonas citri pv. fuscans]SON99727.1 conserved hypothetical protein [Xanthomonas citri pv. fuscans]SOO05517.1 conserved hypothetical protein [Xanthomonas citri pv. fuscans]SOO08261.1 conserved hypothetical protein [Xanthomonas citri pv. fuscans]SOO15357.1 conserved hypothetical protein [Xanthomonas citri pv. fuscans]